MSACSVCGTADIGIFRCSRCQDRCSLRFCGGACFAEAWQQHKALPVQTLAVRFGVEHGLSGEETAESGGWTSGRSEDPELPATLRALLAQAAVPERLRVGLVWQGDGEAPVPQHLWRDAASSARADAACQRTLTLPTGKLSVTLTQGGHLRIINMRPEDARGPCWARYLAQLMWEGEELYLQLDSHMRFVKDWDLKAREQLLHCRSRCLKPVLCSASVSNWKGGRESRYSSCSAEFELTTPD
ncbi:[Skp1-protein]-hydroxyproline N-acetylglucosaminyltransferase (Glycosyltransferase GnT51) (Skp1-HyPro GlcNAc-transferase) (UDP-GlcNAc:Skp1-hydroxyproline GlcNAc-transferase) (Skp1 GlcNAc-Tase) (UDP-GlcNAc:hydroxyproline polypeptide GlcNAc-transferase) [Durusdinium trenchii]|uniref:MYND-type domain-containing protein n=1 Tax=Durusdinium trenchii TaxID=1381693 RepID=A0ABP0SCV4_9DINO